MTEAPRVFGIVPAAGRSRRMGTPKQLLEVGGRSMLRTVLEPLVAARIAGIALVTHSALAGDLGLTHLPGVFIALNDDETSEMIDSVRIGLDAWQERAAVRDDDGFLVCPGDHPGITTADFDACITAFQNAPNKIIVGSRRRRRGHPVIFPAQLSRQVRSSTCDQGLHWLARTHTDRVLLVECTSTGITRDVDTPADHERLT
jgi:molybdenum cofactor cytidylyltransferase